MNIHEYQAKKILSKYGISIPKGKIAYTPNEAKKVATSVSLRGPWMLKAQIQSGARAHGYFLEAKAGKKGGVRQIKSRRDIIKNAEQMLGSTLVTPQTGEKGKYVSRIYVEAFTKVKKVFYTGMVIDRMSATLTLLLVETAESDINEVVLHHPERILKIPLGLEKSISAEKIREALEFLNLTSRSARSLKRLINGMQKTFLECDASMIEINPVGVMRNGQLVALDAKISFDENALYRHKDIALLQDDCETDERELQAAKYKFTYCEFEGNIGCIVNGDGLAMAVMDELEDKGYAAACYLNVKGGVDKDKIASGIKIIMTNPKVEGILINILGGFLRCNLIAEGIIAAASEVGLNVPLVVRFEGTNRDEAKEILKHSKLPVIITDSMTEAADAVIQAIEESD